MRDLILRSVVMFGVAVMALTELLSPFHGLRRGPLAVCWLAIAVAAAWWCYRRRPKLPSITIRSWEAAIAAAIVVMSGIVGLTAGLSPPNSADAMAYHLPRVVYWAQAGSVAFFPTPYFNQIMLQPMAEYVMLHTYLLTGGDRLINLVTFAAFLVSLLGVSAIAGSMGLHSRGQALAALFCATLPNGILQASGAKNDWMLALWLVCTVYFAARRNFVVLGLAMGLALATKGTAYLFAPPLLLAMLLWVWLEDRRLPWLRVAGCLAAGVILMNGPQYARNIGLSGSPLGFDSAQGDGFFRWRNEHPGWKSTASNLLRNTSEQLGARSPQWNQGVFRAVMRAHQALGLDPQDPDTTWRCSRYEAPLNANHEANANNRWHLLILVLAAIFAWIAGQRQWKLYAAALLAGFLLFCFYLKWQPFLGRLELPLFVLGAPLAALLFVRRRPAILAALIGVVLVSNARSALFENWTRPLKGPRSLFVTSRDANYFSDMGQWNNRASYLEAVDRTAAADCDLVGIDISQNQLEYPYQVLLRERNPGVRFLHVGVENVSARYAPAEIPQPCAVFCPDCAAVPGKLERYRPIGPPVVIGRFLLFLRP